MSTWAEVEAILAAANDAALDDPDNEPDFKVLDELSDSTRRAIKKRSILEDEVRAAEADLKKERDRLREVATITTADELGTVFQTLGKPREYGELFMSVVDLPAGSAIGPKQIKEFLDELGDDV